MTKDKRSFPLCPEGMTNCFAYIRKVRENGQEFGHCRCCSKTDSWGPNSKTGKLCPFYKEKRQVEQERMAARGAAEAYWMRRGVKPQEEE